MRRPSPKTGRGEDSVEDSVGEDSVEDANAAVRRDDLVEAGGVSADDAATLEEEEQRRVEEEIALAERLSPGLVAHAVGSPGMSPGMEPTVIDQSPERTRSKFELPEDGETDDEDEEEHHHEPVEQTDVTMSMSPLRVDASVDKENNENGRGVTFAATPDEIRSNNSSRDDLQNSQYSLRGCSATAARREQHGRMEETPDVKVQGGCTSCPR